MGVSRHRRAIGVLLLVLLALGLPLALAQDQHTLRIRSAVAAGDAESASYVARLVGSPPSSGNTVTVLENGDEIFRAMLSALDAARSRLVFETYVYEDGVVADRFTEALARAARRGVAVKIVVDTFGSSGMSDQHVEKLRAAGCEVAAFNAPKWYSLEEINYRTHRKILVVDGMVGFTGGVGVADHWLGDAEDPKHWRDTQFRLDGPIAQLLEAAFYDNFVESGEVVTPHLDPSPAAESGRGEDSATDAPPRDEAIVVSSSASGGASDLKRLYLLTIALARRTVDITSPYLITDESTQWALDDARARGVRVRILMEGDETDARPVKYSSRSNYGRLLDMGIELYEYQPTMMHTKALVVDSIWSMVGSANFDNRSLELNDELNVAIRNRDLAERLTQMFNEDTTRAKRIDRDAWRRRPALERVREGFWHYFGEIF